MGRKRTPWLVGLLLATGVASLLLGAATLSGFGSSGSGDLAGTASWAPANLVAFAIGSAFLLALEIAHSSHRAPRLHAPTRSSIESPAKA